MPAAGLAAEFIALHICGVGTLNVSHFSGCARGPTGCPQETMARGPTGGESTPPVGRTSLMWWRVSLRSAAAAGSVTCLRAGAQAGQRDAPPSEPVGEWTEHPRADGH